MNAVTIATLQPSTEQRPGYPARAAVLHERGAEIVLRDVTLDELRPDEVLVQNLACGICHTDAFAAQLTPLPAVFGHEGTGIVIAAGHAVSGLRAGDHVMASYPYCGSCAGCLEGRPFHCDHHMSLGFSGRRLDGSPTLWEKDRPISGAFFQQSSFATRSVVPERNLVPVAASISPLVRAALPCGAQTGAGAVINTLAVRAGKSIAIFGVGTVGMSALLAAGLVGASSIIAIDLLDARLALARELGATHTINAAAGDVVRRIKDICRAGVDYVVETTGNEQALSDAVASLATGGHCGMVIAPRMGEQHPFATSDIFKRAAKLEGIIQGSAVPRTFLPQLLRWHAQGRFPIDRLVTVYDFADINQAFSDVRTGVTVKPVLRFS
jgi:aryl-alcohol dehydrogenase